jgi:hypothetical protein
MELVQGIYEIGFYLSVGLIAVLSAIYMVKE